MEHAINNIKKTHTHTRCLYDFFIINILLVTNLTLINQPVFLENIPNINFKFKLFSIKKIGGFS
jgi:hypothetical protein